VAEQLSEFTVDNPYKYNQVNSVRWTISHLWRYRFMLIASLLALVIGFIARSQAPVLVGQAADEMLNPTGTGLLLRLSLLILGVLVLEGALQLGVALLTEVIAQKFEADARDELYGSLLGKSQTFHDRQRVGDIMARATDDVKQLNIMLNPGARFIINTVLGIVVPLVVIGTIDPRLLIVPILFVISYVIAVRGYSRRLGPILGMQRFQFGKLNAGLEETISGIEVVKSSAREDFERLKFHNNAKLFRDYFVQQGQAEARYLPLLLFAVAFGLEFIHSIILFRAGAIDLGSIIAVMGLMDLLRFPTFISVWSFSLLQLGLKSADRILEIIKEETELDENKGGYSAPVKGSIIFDGVTFAFGDGKPILHNISFEVQRGQTVAIVGQTGSGKSTMTELVNRTYDVTEGRILVDGVDVREWNLDSLRSQISRIEQDVFLFSRSLSENIAFGAPDTPQEQIEQAAKEAQAHDFIMGFKDDYQTEVGDRGVTLSGGQRQRIAIARAFLSDPRILILDDSTSAIDSATEDRIQAAIKQIQQGRTTLLITHRLSQIRWADTILVVDSGELVAKGSHEDLLRRSPHYRRIFARYDANLPPLEEAAVGSAAK